MVYLILHKGNKMSAFLNDLKGNIIERLEHVIDKEKATAFFERYDTCPDLQETLVYVEGILNDELKKVTINGLFLDLIRKELTMDLHAHMLADLHVITHNGYCFESILLGLINGLDEERLTDHDVDFKNSSFGSYGDVDIELLRDEKDKVLNILNMDISYYSKLKAILGEESLHLLIEKHEDHSNILNVLYVGIKLFISIIDAHDVELANKTADAILTVRGHPLSVDELIKVIALMKMDVSEIDSVCILANFVYVSLDEKGGGFLNYLDEMQKQSGNIIPSNAVAFVLVFKTYADVKLKKGDVNFMSDLK